MNSKISASGIGELLTGGKTAESYLLRKTMEALGISDNLDTKPMQHGTISQYEAYELIVSNMDNAKWHDIYTPINDWCGASADCIGDVGVYDIKCPYYVDTYLEQCQRLPKKYYLQNQMQMIAEGKDWGGVILYLTSPEIDMYGNKIEYPYPLEDRYFIHPTTKDEETQERILKEAEKGYLILVDWFEILANAPTKERDEFFYEQMKGGLIYRKLKTASSIENTIRKAFRLDNEFYYQIKQ
jgi:hypothetical protein